MGNAFATGEDPEPFGVINVAAAEPFAEPERAHVAHVPTGREDDLPNHYLKTSSPPEGTQEKSKPPILTTSDGTQQKSKPPILTSSPSEGAQKKSKDDLPNHDLKTSSRSEGIQKKSKPPILTTSDGTQQKSKPPILTSSPSEGTQKKSKDDLPSHGLKTSSPSEGTQKKTKDGLPNHDLQTSSPSEGTQKKSKPQGSGDDQAKSNAKSNVFDAFAAEATEGGEEEDLDLEAKARKALDCPCVAELKNGPCGAEFSEAFVCYIKSTAEEKGSECFDAFLAMQACIQANQEAFAKYNTDAGDEEDDEEEEEEEEEQQSGKERW